MGAQGTTTVDFGAFPGSDTTSVAVTGQASILAGSLVEAWVYPTATADHSVDEHLYDPPDIIAGTVVAGTGFTIYAKASLPPQAVKDPVNGGRGVLSDKIDQNAMPYGSWTIAWCWN